MILTVSNRTVLMPTSSRESDVLHDLRERLSFPNPQWLENEKAGRWNGRTPKTLWFAEWNGAEQVIPRGYTAQAMSYIRSRGVEVRIDDRRRALPPVEMNFSGVLRPYQEDALEAILKRDFGVLQAPTGSGKTIMALAAIAARKQPALIIVHTKELADQWVNRIESFLDIPRQEIGVMAGGKPRMGERITVALVQTLYRWRSMASERVGHLILNECHRCPARTFEEAVSTFDSKYMLGLSATPFRREGLTKVIYWHLGDQVHSVPANELIEAGEVLRAEVIQRETAFTTTLDASTEYARVLSELNMDPARNALIAEDVVAQVGASPGVCLVLSDRKAQCEALCELISGRGIEVAVLTGDTPASERKDIVDALNDGKVRVLVATGQLIGEGFDCKALTTLFLATPVKFSGRVIQYLGRILRPAPGKTKPLVYDYVDLNVGVLRASARARQRVYFDHAA